MKVLLIIMLFLGISALPIFSQNKSTDPPNISVGEQSIWSVYPDMAEFVINVPACQLTIVRFDHDGNDHQSTYQATLTQSEPHVYRAEFCGDSWVEINAVTGSTTLCHLGKMEAFFPGSYASR